MHCPLCLDTVLDITYHGGIELDICPRCRGVWLDRGELDRIADDAAPDRRETDRERLRNSRNDERPGDDRSERDRPRSKRKKKLGDRLSDVFDDLIDL